MLPQQCIHASQEGDWLLCLQVALMTEHSTLVSLQRTAKQIVEQSAEKLLEVGLEDTQVLALARTNATDL